MIGFGYNDNVMKMHFLLFFVLAALLLMARPPVTGGLPSPVFADSETTTNVPFNAFLDVAGRFSFTLSCRATPSNNVEVAFGTDTNANGVLDPEETDRVVGWDCGSWFTRRRADGRCVTASTTSPDAIRTLSWNLKTGMNGRPSRISAQADGMEVFSDLPLDAVYSPSWNMLRLTGRGLDASLENFSVVVRPDGTAVIMR